VTVRMMQRAPLGRTGAAAGLLWPRKHTFAREYRRGHFNVASTCTDSKSSKATASFEPLPEQHHDRDSYRVIRAWAAAPMAAGSPRCLFVPLPPPPGSGRGRAVYSAPVGNSPTSRHRIRHPSRRAGHVSATGLPRRTTSGTRFTGEAERHGPCSTWFRGSRREQTGG
jgi:hypothetical protein